MLQNPRYRGVYLHGRVRKLRRGGSVQRVKADPTEILMVEIPEWRIVEDDVWLAVQERFLKQGSTEDSPRPTRAQPTHALAGIARCGTCGGAIGCTRTRRGGELVKAYSCTRHRDRGSEVCPVAVHQPIDEVEGALVDFRRGTS